VNEHLVRNMQFEHLYFTKHGGIIYMKKRKTTKLT